MISVQQLTKRFGTDASTHSPALEHSGGQLAVDALSFDIPAGQIVGFLGPNGAGKTTTLKMLTGMLRPTTGTAVICGFDVCQEPVEVKKRIGFVPDSGAVFESLSGLEFLEMIAALYGISRETAVPRIKQFISFFDLSFATLTDKRLGAYSKGMRRKVVITAALLHNPPVVFFDEPLDGLDANAAVGFKALIQTLAREGKTIIYSSHILDVVERVCDRVLIIDKGHLLLDGRPDELVAQHGADSLERLFTRITGGEELERRAQDFARTFLRMTQTRVLDRLFLTLFLRGRSIRGLKPSDTPKSIARALGLALLLYAALGLTAIGVGLIGQSLFLLSFFTHTTTFFIVGMYIASAAGDALFNKEESEILLHRPIEPRALLRAKIGVIVRVSLWLAGAFNLASFVVGVSIARHPWLFPFAHALSVTLSAVFCASCVVVTYQLCLRWFGRERLEGLMTATQIFTSVFLVLGSQILPRVMTRISPAFRVSAEDWRMLVFPTAWFAGLDDAIAGSGSGHAWLLALVGVTVTIGVAWLASSALARDYMAGLQALAESTPRRQNSTPSTRRWLDSLLERPPLRWWMPHSISRAACRLTMAYMMRDRDIKLRLYPSLASSLIMPIVLLAGPLNSTFGVALVGIIVVLTPMQAIDILSRSQQWPAADVFRLAPIPGPGPLLHGLRCAVILCLVLPMLTLPAIALLVLKHDAVQLLLLVPAVLLIGPLSMWSTLDGPAVPLSRVAEERRAATKPLKIIGVMIGGAALTGVNVLTWNAGWFGWTLVVEGLASVGATFALRATVSRLQWDALDA